MFRPDPKPIKQPKEKSTYSNKEFRELYASKTRKKRKYRNKTSTYTSSIYGTKTFHSIKEANYCEELDWQLQSDEIKHYELQPKIELWVNGKHVGNYYCDFKVWDKHDQISYREVKEKITMTRLWQLKWNIVLALRDELIEPGAELIVIK